MIFARRDLPDTRYILCRLSLVRNWRRSVEEPGDRPRWGVAVMQDVFSRDERARLGAVTTIDINDISCPSNVLIRRESNHVVYFSLGPFRAGLTSRCVTLETSRDICFPCDKCCECVAPPLFQPYSALSTAEEILSWGAQKAKVQFSEVK